ncbi:hypothetical protein VM95_30795 [Streptomyces rubellomurinus]|uniref:Geranylgeranyl pyrophosphate synthase n=1 Tax=Streptomyces rubellomurinus (strain ATCC 31215) TaxID=359131 RepID=A0A0F2T6J0_STRR3|nr:hypothetical protein VM95_30795 [Streptomyces rubellomurinus]
MVRERWSGGADRNRRHVQGQAEVEIPEELRRAVDDAVNRSLSSELDARGLLLAPAALEAATADAVRAGADLLRRAVEHCYPDGRAGAYRIEFDDDRAAERIGLGLAFGSVTAHLLAPRRVGDERAATTALSCAVFNLAVGLVDGVCDGAPPLGLELLRTVRSVDLTGAATEPWPDGRLRAALPEPLRTDPTVVFTARLVEAFVRLLHLGHPAEPGAALRERVGARLAEALAAEHLSVRRPAGATTRDQLVGCSRGTSVLPFQIIEHLATGLPTLPPPTAGTLLGEAMWRIDDLVDLCQDAGDGALNAVLLAAADGPWPADPRDGAATLERVLDSGAVPALAAEAAARLEAGLTAAAAGGAESRARPLFLSFVHRYAGIAPRGR